MEETMKNTVPGLHYRKCPSCKVPQIYTEEVCEVEKKGFLITLFRGNCPLCGGEIKIKRVSGDAQSTEKDVTFLQALKSLFS
jgi:hypothetical protein